MEIVKIIKEKICKEEKTKVINICCKDMEEALFPDKFKDKKDENSWYSEFIFYYDKKERRIAIAKSYRGCDSYDQKYKKIKYCPFCGKKIWGD